jgi:hypothetical protein
MQIKHTSGAGYKPGNILLKHDSINKLKINTELVTNDINRLMSEIGKFNNKLDDDNIKTLVKYLNKLKKHISKKDSTFEMSWNNDKKDLPVAYPISFIYETIYGVDAANYIEVGESESLVSIDISEMADIIAYEFIFKEIGETRASIENMLSKCSIISANDTEVLSERFNTEIHSPYAVSKHLLIEDCIWIDRDEKVVHDYFSTKNFAFGAKTRYKDVVGYSCKFAATLIVDKLMQKCNDIGVTCDVIEISATRITLMLRDFDSYSVDFKRDIMEDIDIQAFGRLFRVKTGISIY